MNYSAYVQKHILEPLGMHETGFAYTEEVERRMARPYVNETPVPNYDIGYVAPAGQMYSNIRDLMKLGRYYLGVAGELFDDCLRRELLTPGFLFRDGEFLVGSPWEIQFLNGSRWTMFGKGGNVWGHSAVLGIIPPLNLSFAALWSGGLDETTFVAKAYEQVLPAFVPALESQRPQPGRPQDPTKYLGTYRAEGQEEVVSRIESVALPQGSQALSLVTLAGEREAFRGILDFRDNKTAAVSAGDQTLPTSCFDVMALGQLRAWITFDLLPDGEAAAFEMPGDQYGVVFRRAERGGALVV